MHPQVKGDFRDPQYWDPLMVSFPYYSHIFGDSYGSGMGIVWERGPNIGGPWKFHWLVKCIIFYSPKWQGDNVLPVKNAAHAHGTKTYCGSFKAWTLWASTDLQMHLPTTSTKPGFRNSWEHGAGSSSCHKVPAVSGLFSWTAGQIVGVDGIHDGMVWTIRKRIQKRYFWKCLWGRWKAELKTHFKLKQ